MAGGLLGGAEVVLGGRWDSYSGGSGCSSREAATATLLQLYVRRGEKMGEFPCVL